MRVDYEIDREVGFMANGKEYRGFIGYNSDKARPRLDKASFESAGSHNSIIAFIF